VHSYSFVGFCYRYSREGTEIILAEKFLSVKTCSVSRIAYPSVSYLSQKVMSEVSVSRRRRCWSEGRIATLRSKSPLLSRCSDRDSRQGHPSLRSAPDEDRRRRHPTVRPRPAQRPTCDPAHYNGPCVAAACYGPIITCQNDVTIYIVY
jgi:hypothetical protein